MEKIKNSWHIEQVVTRCLNGDWYIVNGDNYEMVGELDMYLIVFVSHRLAIRKDFPTPETPSKIAYFPPWDNTYFITN